MCSGIIIYSNENHKSFYQIAGGFVLFVFPFAFLSSFFSKIGSFIFLFVSIIIVYLVTKFYYTDFWLGVLLASIIGGAIYLYVTAPAIKKMNEYKPFSPSDYKEKAKQFHKNK